MASRHVLSKPSFLALSQARRTRSGREAALPSNDLRPSSIVERSVPRLISEWVLRTKIRFDPQPGTGTSLSATSPVL